MRASTESANFEARSENKVGASRCDATRKTADSCAETEGASNDAATTIATAGTVSLFNRALLVEERLVNLRRDASKTEGSSGCSGLGSR
jgi:hypothetical protein